MVLVKGLCSPEAATGNYEEQWEISTSEILPDQYRIEAYFFDNTKRSWWQASGKPEPESALLAPQVSLGILEVTQ